MIGGEVMAGAKTRSEPRDVREVRAISYVDACGYAPRKGRAGEKRVKTARKGESEREKTKAY